MHTYKSEMQHQGEIYGVMSRSQVRNSYKSCLSATHQTLFEFSQQDKFGFLSPQLVLVELEKGIPGSIRTIHRHSL